MSAFPDWVQDNNFSFCKKWIKNQIEHKTLKNKIYCLMGSSEGEFQEKLKTKIDEEFWPSISFDDWKTLVDYVYSINGDGQGFVGQPPVKPLVAIPDSPKSAWVQYKKMLEKNGFNEKSRESIEKSAQWIVSQLKENTNISDPIRGMVLGNVQSGKTANMEAVMALAADYHYNFFIILTGTIDNLRKQTQDRICDDLITNCGGANGFRLLENLSEKSTNPNRLADLELDEKRNMRYFYVCLKNSKVLEHLIKWLNKSNSSYKKKQLRIVLIDDEADQAGVNTANIDEGELSKINSCIKQIVFCNNGSQNLGPYSSMNYIGYTATPYANLLNEASEDSLYPKNFIASLETPDEYIGPKQIFGLPDVAEQLNIVNTIDDDEIDDIKKSISFVDKTVPAGLRDALLWFVCTVAIFRLWDLKMPVSMLVHTSQKIVNHQIAAEGIRSFFYYFKEQANFMSLIEDVYKKEVAMMPLTEFLKTMKEYDKADRIKSYPDFSEISQTVKELICGGLTNIEMSKTEGTLQYSKKIHLCIDDCYSNNQGDYQLRIVYPDKTDKKTRSICPAFIVVGGATLSRGLTLEGLTTSYFVRGTIMADTLMQMGRWFGYRRKYELLPRIWLSKGCQEQFEKLTLLDDNLRSELKVMEINNNPPSSYAPRLLTFPDYQYLRITAKKKMQKAEIVQISLTNKSGQTTKFFDIDERIKSNFDEAVKFVNSLGKDNSDAAKALENPLNTENNKIWFNVDHLKVLNFLSKLQYPTQDAFWNVSQEMKDWFAKKVNGGILKNFNVILSNVGMNGGGEFLQFDNFKIRMAVRRKLSNHQPGIIDLKILSRTNDKLVDIDYKNLSSYDQQEFKDNNSHLNVAERRAKFGAKDVPILVMYFVDKNSGNGSKNSETGREPLNTCQHLFGYYIYIPRGNETNGVDTDFISVKLEFDNEEEGE